MVYVVLGISYDADPYCGYYTYFIAVEHTKERAYSVAHRYKDKYDDVAVIPAETGEIFSERVEITDFIIS